MRRLLVASLLGICLFLGSFLIHGVLDVQAEVLSQNPGVTPAPGRAGDAYVIILNNEQGFANLRSGPGTLGYDIVGQMVIGQQAPALGRTLAGEWIQVAFPSAPGGVAWIYTDLVELFGNVPIIEIPPTPTPLVSPTIDQTLAAQFVIESPPTRLPTFTPPPPLSIPNFTPDPISSEPSRLPIGMVIIILGCLGLIGLIISLLRSR